VRPFAFPLNEPEAEGRFCVLRHLFLSDSALALVEFLGYNPLFLTSLRVD